MDAGFQGEIYVEKCYIQARVSNTPCILQGLVKCGERGNKSLKRKKAEDVISVGTFQWVGLFPAAHPERFQDSRSSLGMPVQKGERDLIVGIMEQDEGVRKLVMICSSTVWTNIFLLL